MVLEILDGHFIVDHERNPSRAFPSFVNHYSSMWVFEHAGETNISADIKTAVYKCPE